jgi:hypothetical protein
VPGRCGTTHRAGDTCWRTAAAVSPFSGTLLTQSSTCATAVSMVRSVVSSNSASVLGSIGATLRSPSLASRSARSCTRSRILAAIPLPINCLRRLSARIARLAVRNTLVVASGKTTVPMSRPSATSPGGRRKARCRNRSALRTAGSAATSDAAARSPRCGWRRRPPRRPAGSTSRRTRRRASRRSPPPPPHRRSRQFRRAVRRGGQPIEGARIEIVPAERLRHARGDGPLARRGGAVDGDHRHRPRHRRETLEIVGERSCRRSADR